MGTLTSSPEEPRAQLANTHLVLPHIQNIQVSHTLVQYTFQMEAKHKSS